MTDHCIGVIDVVQATRKCSFDGCGRDAVSKKLCQTHYRQLWSTGKTQPIRKLFKSPEDALKKKSKRVESGCIEWTGAKSDDNYGYIRVNGKMTSVHRFAWTLVHGELLPGEQLDHICFNPSCVNVDHLRILTQMKNAQHSKGAYSNSSTGIRGVTWNKRHKKYHALVGHKGKRYYLGSFDDPIEAGKAAALKRKELGFPLSNHDRQLINGTFRLAA